jgi:hypothetical protein
VVLESAAVPFTSLWQHVLPNKGLKQTMTNREFHTTCTIQLLIPIMQGGTCVECRKDADQFGYLGYHIVTCKGTCNANHERHQIVVRAFNDLAMVAGLILLTTAPSCKYELKT